MNMKKLVCILLAFFLGGTLAQAEATADTTAATAAAPTTSASVPDSKSLEKSLQALSWPQFKAVVEAVPKLKADVDAYGEFGWQYVQMNYQNYRWKKSIDKLSDEQKQQLATLIQSARRKK